jgi:hypothetical protein
MSGGSYDYAYGKIEDLAEQIHPTSALRKAFKKHLMKVAQACHDIEWVDSCDCSEGDEDKAIKACLGQDADKLAMKELIIEALSVHENLMKAINTGLERSK